MKPSDISWNWRFAGFGAVMALAALITILSGEVLYGTFLLIGLFRRRLSVWPRNEGRGGPC